MAESPVANIATTMVKSPVASETSPQRLKRRTIVDNQTPILTLSPLSPNLEAPVNGFQEAHLPEKKPLTSFSPKKPKLSLNSQNPPPISQESADELVNLRHVGIGSSIVGINERIQKLGLSLKNCSQKQTLAKETYGNLGCFLQNLVNSRFQCSKSMKVEVIDETALIGVSMIRKKDKRIARNAVSNPNGRRKFVYSRKEMEGLRFVNVKGQKQFWQEIYNNFGEIVKRDYDQLGNSRHQYTHHGRIHQNSGVKSNYGKGILDSRWCIEGRMELSKSRCY